MQTSIQQGQSVILRPKGRSFISLRWVAAIFFVLVLIGDVSPSFSQTISATNPITIYLSISVTNAAKVSVIVSNDISPTDAKQKNKPKNDSCCKMIEIITVLLSVIILFVFLLKIYEMAYHCYLIRKNSQNLSALDNWPISEWLEKRTPANVLFKLPVLILISVIFFTIFQQYLPMLCLVCYISLILTSIVLELFQSLLSRLTYGHQDIHFRQKSVHGKNAHSGDMTYNEKIKALVEFVGGFVLITIAGFAGAYEALSYIKNDAFNVPLNIFSSFYFSVITFVTIGYGDIVPISLAARIIITLEAFTSMGILIFLILAYSTTSQPDSEDDCELAFQQANRLAAEATAAAHGNNLTLARDFWRRAGEKYRQALEIKPSHIKATINWADTLSEEAKFLETFDPKEAERLRVSAREKLELAAKIEGET